VRSGLWLGPMSGCCSPGRHGNPSPPRSTALVGLPHSLVDVSHRQVALRITGPRASDLLASGCPLDLDPDAFPVGMCTRTVLARAEVVLWRLSPEEYHLETGRSFSGYVLEWLREAERGG
jgi:sarcosine oxidase subunit gamma